MPITFFSSIRGHHQNRFDTLCTGLFPVLEIIVRLGVFEIHRLAFDRFFIQSAFLDGHRSLADVALGKSDTGAHEKPLAAGIQQPQRAGFHLHHLRNPGNDILQHFGLL